MAVFSSQIAILPSAVRKHKIEHLPFLGWRLTLELLVGLLCDAEQADAFLDVALVR
ncbi:MAG TPA: hypothetical protein VN428_00605 [Bryobacteraceae bacterium]|nr:hypothetical protein [Bryobacteraceae bacterium]